MAKTTRKESHVMTQEIPRKVVVQKLLACACILGAHEAVEIIQSGRASEILFPERRSNKKSSKKSVGAVHAKAAGRGFRSVCGAVKGPDGHYAEGEQTVTCLRCKSRMA